MMLVTVVQTLLPPSSFESTTDLSKATAEIMKLKKENLTLRYSYQTFII